MAENNGRKGIISRIAGAVVQAQGMEDVHLYDMVRVGERGLIGEVIRLSGGVVTLQVYEETSGLRLGEPVINAGHPLSVTLGPGMIGQVYDGLQRPLVRMAEEGGNFIQRGTQLFPLPEERAWEFEPQVEAGDSVVPGDVLGVIAESQSVKMRLLVPPGFKGQVAEIASGELTIQERAAVLELEKGEQQEVGLTQNWPVRRPRPIAKRINPREPLVTGTRVIDTFFPVAIGGAAIIPGGFGTGKTVTQHSLSRWSDVDIVVYVGCGERGNEMAEVLEEFPHLEDPRTGAPLMERTVLIANTSNMPVAAREASIYTGITIAEYYRDMGYDVLMLADSTSRWGEALREISGRLEEMPSEAGYPAYLASRLADFYERAGRVECLGSGAAQEDGGRVGSVTVVGAVSPPGGDFSEPITQNSMRVTGTFWALDSDLSRRRHFPAINWNESYSLYEFTSWFTEEVAEDWEDLTDSALSLLEREGELQEIVELVGPDELSPSEQLTLFVADMLRVDYLQQSAFHEIDRFSPLEKSYWMLKVIMDFYQRAKRAVESGVRMDRIRDLPEVGEIARMKEVPVDRAAAKLQALQEDIHAQFAALK